jgi:peptide/nickel transport system substrate-binding protein
VAGRHHRRSDERTIEFTLDEPYSPFLEATTRGILPAHRWQGVTAVSLPDHALNRNPIGSGPFVVEADQEWQRTRRLRLVPHAGPLAAGHPDNRSRIPLLPR